MPSRFPIRMCIAGEDESQWNKHPHREWRCDLPGVHILTGNGDVTNQECISSLGMGMCLTENGYVTDLLGMHILTKNAHSLFLVIHEIKSSSY